MELGAKELLTIGVVLSGLAGTWAVIKATVARIQEDLKAVGKEIASLNARLDATESGDAVMKHQINVIGSMLSPKQQEQSAREIEGMIHRLNSLRRDVDHLMTAHNGTHIYIPPPGKDDD